MTTWPVTLEDVRAAQARIAPLLPPTPARSYAELDERVGSGIRVVVKHENFQRTGSFKVRNGLALATLPGTGEQSGLVAATRGNHGLGLAFAGHALGRPVTIVVPHGNNPEKNACMRAYGARLIEEGRDYDEAVEVMQRLAAAQGLAVAHSTNDPRVIAGAGTLTLELLDQAPDLEALVIGVGGGSQAVGALTVCRALAPKVAVYAVQAAGAAAIHDAWHAGRPVSVERADTFADGLATRRTYELTFPALREGLAGFVTVTDAELAEALRWLLATTHTLVEGAGAAGLARVPKLRDRLAGKVVGIVLSGANIDRETLRRVLAGEL